MNDMFGIDGIVVLFRPFRGKFVLHFYTTPNILCRVFG